MVKSLWCVVGVVALIAGPTLAEDIQPPPWRGEWSTTSQVWEFFTPVDPGLPVPPDGPAPGGMPPLPSTQIIYDPGPTDGWKDVWFNREGVLPLSGWIDVLVDNHEPPNEYKEVWVQITWRPQEQGARPELLDFDPMYDPTWPPVLVDADVPLGDGWLESTYTWRIYPNPVDEFFTIGGLIDVDELVIDTWCIPEPATLGLLLVGVAGLVRRRVRV